MLSWFFLLFAPVYYSTDNLHPIYTSVLLINPITHCLNLVRSTLGFNSIISIFWSFIYLMILIVILGIYSLKTFKSVYILEKFY
ncbi:ABC-type multidrug transport system, permease component [Dictyoglomus thermophilum H-6-12]|uniref:ABC-type multidrug transport system, permease component n=1 Tax=Dictyoglomus thermophilum (strain ATCC 35947 / DSM 3960 / H-6-12) TaxID=309799 RepID=B5YC01_DICT6|nr:ABC-type multidrug transport system, permease component [Dictyoglomus thermophilum H-6-12]